MQVGVILADRRDCDEPPENQSVDDQGVSWRDPETKLEEECVEFYGHKHDAEAQHLDESPRPEERVPLVFVPPRGRKLAQCSFHLQKNKKAKKNNIICIKVELNGTQSTDLNP